MPSLWLLDIPKDGVVSDSMRDVGSVSSTPAFVERRDQTVGAFYIGVKTTMSQVQTFTEQDDDLIAEAFKQAEEAAKRVLASRSDFLVETY